MFLADRLRTVLRIKAAGGPTLGSAAVQEDELDEKLLDSVRLAGSRQEYCCPNGRRPGFRVDATLNLLNAGTGSGGNRKLTRPTVYR